MKLLVVGQLSYDRLVKLDHIPREGECAVILGKSEYYGGRGANVAVATTKLGLDTALAGIGGEDSQKYTDYLEKCGVDTHFIQIVQGVRTSHLTRYYRRDRVLSIYHPTTEPLFEEFKFEPEGFDHIHLSILGDKSTPRLLTQIEGFKGIVSYGLGAETQQISPTTLELILQYADYLFMNQEEALALIKALNSESISDVFEYGIRALVVTRGSEGSIVHTPREDFHIKPILPRVFAGALGAGDAYIAGFIQGISMGAGLYHCGVLGAAVASFCLEGKGPQEDLPTRDEAVTRYGAALSGYE